MIRLHMGLGGFPPLSGFSSNHIRIGNDVNVGNVHDDFGVCCAQGMKASMRLDTRPGMTKAKILNHDFPSLSLNTDHYFFSKA